jgi:hypothetical protein
MKRLLFFLSLIVVVSLSAAAQTRAYELDDSHFHLTNYIQEGTSIQDFLKIMGDKVGRVALFGIPLQQQWSYRVDGDHAPTYYLNTDAPLYYYSFTDAWIAMAYKSLTREQQARFDPMITGFNPTDMYAADHIRRVLQTFPGVFTGIGEFTIHKGICLRKNLGEVASLQDPALDKIFDFTAEAGLVSIPVMIWMCRFPKEGSNRPISTRSKAFSNVTRTPPSFGRATGGRIVRPVKNHAAAVRRHLERLRL